MKQKKTFLSAMFAGCLMLAACNLFLSSCKKEVTAKEDVHKLEANLLLAKDKFTQAMNHRQSSQPFEILKVVRDENQLEVTVRGGNSAGSFAFIWDGLIRHSYPAGIQLLLTKEAENNFDPTNTIVLTVNLQKIIGDKNNVKDFHFFVINGSLIQTATLQPDGVASFENK